MAEAAEFQGTFRGTTPPAAFHRIRSVLILLAVLLVCLGMVQLSAAPTARADGTGSRTVSISVDSLTPVAPTQNDKITISGTVTNKGRSTVSAGHIGLRVGGLLSTRSEIDDIGDRTAFSPGTDGPELTGHTQKIGKLQPGISREFTLTVPAKDLNLDRDGVYPLGVSFSGQTADQQYERVLGIRRTLLPWQPAGADGKKTKVTFLWPLISDTHLTARTESDQQQTPIFPDDDLAAELAPGGRLQQLVALGKDLHVTWVIDPDLLATVEAMTKSYQVAGPGGKDTPGRGQAVAKQWLGQLQAAVNGKEVVALPFGDPDIASLAHHGTNGTLGHLQSATELAAMTVDTILQVKPRTDFAWPVDGAIDHSVVDVGTSAGAHNIIARSDSLREPDGSPYAPTAARQIGGGVTAVVADARLSTAFEGDMSRAGDASLAVQRFLAQSLMINKQAPENERSIVVAPQRMPTTSQAQAMATALGGLSAGRWSQPLDDLSDAAKAKPDPAASRRVPGSGSYPDALRAQELPTEAFTEIQKTQDKLSSFKTILTSPDRVVIPFGSAITREMSTSWRGDPAGASDFRAAVQSYLETLQDQVKLVAKSDATLSGRSATIPVTVKNGLLQGVDHLYLQLESTQPNRLKVTDKQPVKIDGGHSQSVKFETRAYANGPVTVKARLYTADGQQVGEAMPFTVHVTSITPMVLLVIAGGVLLLVLAGLRIYLKRKRSGSRDGAGDGPEAGGEGPSDGGDNGGGEPERPGDPAADTGTGSDEPSRPGEKVER
ncbi:DUF6049 family protein [Streptomyces huiliensis]|uniref:DUF6049 family protein n=1 Tax=Streptomyces huiliensis TaxID=2876027 RepID=UPI001CBC7437|nr:DUF6049 family protein [Streptomyces huiliensis]MBZ4320083.1 DUF6049 family protein [Streptomyces huiliensis]